MTSEFSSALTDLALWAKGKSPVLDVDWADYDRFDWAGSQQAPMSDSDRRVVGEFVGAVLGVTTTRGAWGFASEPGRFAATVINVNPRLDHRYRARAVQVGFHSVAVKVFKTGVDATREAEKVVPFHRDGLCRLPGMPNPRVQRSLDAGFAVDGAGQRRGFVVQQWVSGPTLRDWVRRRWAAAPPSGTVIGSILHQLLGEIVVPLWGAGTVWWDVRDANLCFEPLYGRLTMIDMDSLGAYADEIFSTPQVWARRDKGRHTALARLRNMTLRLLLAQGFAGKTAVGTELAVAWRVLEPSLLALGTGADATAAAQTAVAVFVDRLGSRGLLRTTQAGDQKE